MAIDKYLTTFPPTFNFDFSAAKQENGIPILIEKK